MNLQLSQQELAGQAAEEILRTIYGDDFTGCAVSLDSIAAIVLKALREDLQLKQDLLEVYGKSAEALELLSRPPADALTLNPVELQRLLSDRLDSIHELTVKLAGLSEGAPAKPAALDELPPLS